MKHREPDWGVRLLLMLGVLIVLAFSSLRLAAQTQPVGGSVASITAGAGGGPSLFANGSAAAPSMAFASSPGLGCWLAGANSMACGGSGAANDFRVINNGGTVFAAGATAVTGIWTVTQAGALQNVSSTSGTIVMATTTIFNASGTLRNAPMNFNELNLYLTAAGMQGWCGNCVQASAVDQTCAAGAGTGSLAVRDAAGVFKCFS